MQKYQAKTIAKWFLNRIDRDAGDVMTHLRLQKLIYFAQAWHLANFNETLFDEDMQAWRHGPVVPSVWREYQSHGFAPIPAGNGDVRLSDRAEKMLSAIYEKYGKFNAKELERITHRHRPWQETRGGLPLEAACSDPIEKELIRDFYAERIGKEWDGAVN